MHAKETVAYYEQGDISSAEKAFDQVVESSAVVLELLTKLETEL